MGIGEAIERGQRRMKGVRGSHFSTANLEKALGQTSISPPVQQREQPVYGKCNGCGSSRLEVKGTTTKFYACAHCGGSDIDLGKAA